MNWKIGEAKQRFSEVVREAADEPQRIYRRERLVAGVIDAETLEEFLEWKRRRERRTVADAFDDLRRIRGDESPIDVPRRRNRRQDFG